MADSEERPAQEKGQQVDERIYRMGHALSLIHI